MKTIITEQIQDFTIIKGFGELQIDPVETNNNIKLLLVDMPISKKIENKIREAKVIHKIKNDNFEQLKFAMKTKDAKKYNKADKAIRQRKLELNDLNDDMIELKKELKQKIRKLKKENRVYFEPKAGEIRVNKKKYKNLSALYIDNKQRGNLTDVDGNEVIDKRGIQYVKEGQIITITELNNDVDGPLVYNLTAEALARLIYEYMSLQQIEDEKQIKRNDILNQAAFMRSKLEIEGNPDALTLSQQWFYDQETILNQTYANFEVVIVDDSSNDNTHRIIEQFRDKRIRYFRNKTFLGLAGSRNQSIKFARHEYVFFTDSDCCLDRKWIEEGKKHFENPNCVGVEGKTIYVSDKYEPTRSDSVIESSKGRSFMTCNMAYKKAVLEKLGGFDLHMTCTFPERQFATVWLA